MAKINEELEGTLNLLSNDILIAAATGKVNLNKIASEIMGKRGYDAQNKWVGFSKAEGIWATITPKTDAEWISELEVAYILLTEDKIEEAEQFLQDIIGDRFTSQEG